MTHWAPRPDCRNWENYLIKGTNFRWNKFLRSKKNSKNSHFAGINFRSFVLFWTNFFHFPRGFSNFSISFFSRVQIFMILLKNCEKTKILIPAKISSLKVVPKLYEKNFDFKVPGTFCLIRGKLLNAKNNNEMSSAFLFAHWK